MGIMHACLLNTFPNVDVTALCDKSRLIRTIAKQPFKNALVTDNLEKFADLNLDAIFVLTPIPSSLPNYQTNLYPKTRQKRVCRKNLNRKLQPIRRTPQIIPEQHAGVNMVGYMKRFAVTFNQAKTLLNQQVLGDLTSFDAYAFSSDFAEVPEGSTISMARGGVLKIWVHMWWI